MRKNDTDQSPKLFTDDEIVPIQLTSEPVTCLGMTFSSDEERREYFRAELRRKLPELRQIEGFPIGEDDDIIALSDPPYYTACPNPWLNDFIAEWEQEKTQLEAEGKRTKDFSVWEPYASDVSEGKSNPIYTVHTYHTKVPHPAIMRYILYYTQPGDIVLDGFAGTGMTGLAAQSCADPNSSFAQKIAKEWQEQFGIQPFWGERHAICGDLSPYAANISRFYNSPQDAITYKREVETILKQMQTDCGWLYEVKDDNGNNIGRINFVVWSDVFVCPNCGREYVFWNAAIDEQAKCLHSEFPCPHCNALQTKKTAKPALETVFDVALGKNIERIKSVPVIIVYKNGNKTFQKEPSEYDKKLLLDIEKAAIIDFFPTRELPVGYNTEQPKKARKIYYVHQFFTRRNLMALSHLYSLINQSKMKHKLLFLFTGMLQRSSMMNRVHVNNYFNGGGGWNGGFLKGTLYIPNAPTETSVIEQISDKLSAICNAIPFLPKKNNNLQYVGSASDISLENNSIDYIFIDPPFGSNINYSELNSLIEPWLKVITNNANEAIENIAQNKNAEFYRVQMTDCFREFFRVLKPQKWMTVEFSNTSASVWNSIQTALQSVGFVIVNVAALDKKQGSFKAVTTTTAVKQDLVITCFKPSDRLRLNLEQKGATQQSAQDFIEELLIHLPVHVEKDNSTTAIVERSAKILYDRLISYYVQHGYTIPMDAKEFQQMLHDSFIERDGMFFTASQAVEYEEKRAHTTEFVPMALFISSEAEGIEWLKRHLSKKPQTYQELQPEWMKDMAAPKKGDIIPELRDILEENFIEESDGTWRNPDAEKAADLEILRNRRMLKEFTAYMEQATKPKAKRMKDCRLAVLQYGFKECYRQKRFADIVAVGDHIPESLLTEDEVLLQYYDIALTRI